MATALTALGGEPLNGERTKAINVALDRGDFAKASEGALALAREQPNSAEAHVLLARAEIGLNLPAEALGHLHAALRRDIANVDALYYVSKLTAILSGQEFVALEKLAPDSSRAHQVRAEALASKGESAEAGKEYAAALRGKPNAPFLLNAMADLKRHDEKYAEASEWYAKALKAEPENFDALYGMGACLLRSHQAAPSVPFFRHALKIDSESNAAAMALGEALLDSDGASEAIDLLQRAAVADPTLQRVQFLLGKAYRSLGREKEAQLAFDRYREISKEAKP